MRRLKSRGCRAPARKLSGRADGPPLQPDGEEIETGINDAGESVWQKYSDLVSDLAAEQPFQRQGNALFCLVVK
jgi:hypothetical protein